jgi:hypothetical protein
VRAHLLVAFVLLAAACGDNLGNRGGGPHHGDGGPGPGGGDGGVNPGGPSFDSMCNGAKTTISGVVLAPNAVDPVANAFVYVPITTSPFSSGVDCELCGSPIDSSSVQAVSDPGGHFVLDIGPLAPASQLQFTVNKGRFRRTMMVPINSCMDNNIGAPFTQLPGKTVAGTDDIPKIAVGTGGKDQLDVVLAAMGLDQSVGFDCYENRKSTTATLMTPCGKQLAAKNQDLTSMLKDPNQLANYNIVFISCSRGKWASLAAADQQTIAANLKDWAGKGGRLFATDNSYDYVSSAFPSDITWATGGTAPDTANVGVGNTSMPITYTGKVNDTTMAQWMTAVSALTGGSTTVMLTGYLDQWSAIASVPTTTSDVVDATDAKIYTAPMMPGPAGTVPQATRFDVTPPGGMNACGRVIYASYHTLSPTMSIDSTQLSPQERILEYLMFEAGSCVGSIN